jgi:hypothetical protein
MRKVVRAFLGTALCLCLVGAVAVAAAPKGSKAQPVSVGFFAKELARAMNLKVSGDLTEASAVKALRELGLSLGSPKGQLTEGRLVTVLGQLGINVRTSNPGRSVTEAKASAVVRTFRGELGRAAAASGRTGIESSDPNPNDDFNNGNGKGGKFKRKANLSPGGKTDD